MRQRSASSVAHAYSKLQDHDAEPDKIERGPLQLPRSRQMYMRRPSKTSLLLLVVALVFLLYSVSLFFARLSHEYHEAVHYSGPPGKHLVIASFKDQDVDWLKEVPSSWTPYRYFLDDPQPENNLSVPQNLGREAMAYLTYIIDNYDNLPDYVIFTHGHRRSWHQVEPLPWKIRALNLTALDRENYISLRCEDAMGCENVPFIDISEVNWDGEKMLPEFWEAVLPDLPMPTTLSYKCCAQFAVTRRAIKQHPLDRWRRLRDPLLQDLEVLKTETKWGAGPPAIDAWSIGTFWEKIWHVVLSGEANLCPSVEQCHQEHFSNAILCAGGAELHVFNPFWDDVKCVSAFEHVKPDDEPNWAEWYKPVRLSEQWARAHKMRADSWRARDKAVADAKKERKQLKGEMETKQKILDHRNKRIQDLEARLQKLGQKV